MCENKFYKQAREELAYLSGKKDFKRLVDARAGFLRDQEIEKNESKKEGRQEGRLEGKAEIAKKMNDFVKAQVIQEITFY